MSADENETLLSAAESIADGTGVAWDRLLDDGCGAGDVAVVRALLEIGKIAAFHRSVGSTESTPIEGAVPTGSLGAWGHLTLLEKNQLGQVIFVASDSNVAMQVRQPWMKFGTDAEAFDPATRPPMSVWWHTVPARAIRSFR